MRYGVFSPPGGNPRPGVGVGDAVLDLAALATAESHEDAALLTAATLNPLMAAGPSVWRRVAEWLTERLGDERRPVEPNLWPLGQVRLHLPFTVADYVDFYSSEHHAANVGRMFRPGGDPLPVNWKHLPAGYHGRAGTVVVSGTPIVRPAGQHRPGDGDAPGFGPSEKLDVEAEVGFVVGVPSRLGEPVGVSGFAQHVFGICLVNDWSARDLQAWEYVPLGPFLGKSFATSVSPWVVPLAALEHAWVDPPAQDPAPLAYLRPPGRGLDLDLEVEWNGMVVSRPPFRTMYWTPAQQLAHLTANGASVRTGDLYASGTVSGPEPDQRGSFLELSWNGGQPVTFDDGTTRTFLADGDTVVIRGTAPGPDGSRIGLGEVAGTVEAARR